MMDPITQFLLENSSTQGYLYHYSTEKLSLLQTLKKQTEEGIVSERGEKKTNKQDPLGRGLSYDSQISFFLEPIPIDEIREKMPENRIYNQPLYEHVIKIDSLEEKIVYQIVSAPFEALFMTFLTSVTKNVGLMVRLMRVFAKVTTVLYKRVGREDLKTMQKRYEGRTLEDFRNWFESTLPGKVNARKTSYQAGVVHVKVYPESGDISVDSVRRI